MHFPTPRIPTLPLNLALCGALGGLTIAAAAGAQGTDATPAAQRVQAEVDKVLESYLIGSIAFDFAGAPDHLEIRRVRRRMLAHEAFDPLTRSPEQIGELNESAFVLGCDALLDRCERLASP